MREWGVVQVMSYAPPKGRSLERIGAGAKLSHAIGQGEAKGHYVSGFHPTRTRLPDKNGAGWSAIEASKGGDSAMP
jgi:hypothetical protein